MDLEAERLAPVSRAAGMVGMTVGQKQVSDSSGIDAVTREWEAKLRREIADERYSEMRANYTVVLETPEIEESRPATGAAGPQRGHGAPAVSGPDEPGERQAM